MKIGIVRNGHRGLCPYADLTVRSRSGRHVVQTALIDTGFNGYLSLPLSVVQELGLTPMGANIVELANAAEENVSLFVGEVAFGEDVNSVPIHGIGSEPTIGTALFRSCRLSIDFVVDGDVEITSME